MRYYRRPCRLLEYLEDVHQLFCGPPDTGTLDCEPLPYNECCHAFISRCACARIRNLGYEQQVIEHRNCKYELFVLYHANLDKLA